MVERSKEKQALYLLQWVLWQARSMALHGQAGETIAEILDWAELMPSYIGSEKDQTTDFQEVLDALAEKFPEWQEVLRTFGCAEAVR